MLEPHLRDLDRFFIQPGADALTPGMQGQACANLRHALDMLGYSIGPGAAFDEQLHQTLTAFQRDCHHIHCDGRCGSGTRALLVRRLFETGNQGFFNARAPDPQERRRGICFISYARADAALVAVYAELFEAWGFQVWIDREDIPGGAEWEKMLRDKIAESYLVVAFVTPALLASKWCRVEAQHAARCKKAALSLQFAQAPPLHWARRHLLAKRLQQMAAPPPDDILNAGAAAFRARVLNTILAHQQAALRTRPEAPRTSD